MMKNLLSRLWADDQGAVISTELILVIGILIFGIIPGLVALRNAIIASYVNIGNTLVELIPSFTYSGFVVGGSPGGNIALINGYEAGVSVSPMTAVMTPPLAESFAEISPSP
jgi:Flp pilus assembly pilin Flp